MFVLETLIILNTNTVYLKLTFYSIILLQVRSSCMLPGSSRPWFISSGLSCVRCCVATDGSVHIKGVHQCQWQGEGQMFLLASACRTLQKTEPLKKSFLLCLTLFNCVSWVVVHLVDTSSSDPECQQHGSFRAVCSHWSAAPVRSLLPVVPPLPTTPGSFYSTRITQLLSSTGQKGLCHSYLG